MRVCYIILTCQMFLYTRTKWQKETFLKDVDEKDVYFIANKDYSFLGDYGSNIYGWNTLDRYEGCPLKYIRFFQNMDLDYDWYVFIDDDSFIHTKHLNLFLSKHNPEEKLCMGKRINGSETKEKLKIDFMQGGAGFVLSRPLYIELKDYIRNTEEEKLHVSRHGDHSLALWIHLFDNIQYIHDSRFHDGPHNNEEELQDFISFHYVKSFNDFKFYYEESKK